MESLTLRQLILVNNTIQIKIPRCQIEFEVPQVCAYIYILWITIVFPPY